MAAVASRSPADAHAASLGKDLDNERKWMTKRWAKRDCDLLIVLEATSSGMYGDLRGVT